MDRADERPRIDVVRNLITRATNTWQYSTNGLESDQVSRSPDSQSLSFTTATLSADTTSWMTRAWAFDLSNPCRSPGGVHPIPLASGAFWAGFISSIQGIEVVQHTNFLDQGDWFDPSWLMLPMVASSSICRLSQAEPTKPAAAGDGRSIPQATM